MMRSPTGRAPSVAVLLSLVLVSGACGTTTASSPAATPTGFLKPYRFSRDWFSSRLQNWKRILAEFQGKPDVHYLEIGVFEGRSFIWMLENILTHPSARATGIDIFPDDLEARFRSNLELTGVVDKVTVLKGRSQTVLRGLPLESFEIIYVDGSHVAKDALTDAVLSWQLLKPGGILIFDDYLWRPNESPDTTPHIAIDAFMTMFRDEFEVVLYGYQVALRKKLGGVPGRETGGVTGRTTLNNRLARHLQ